MSIAPTGHTGTQLPQATQRSVEILTRSKYIPLPGLGVAPGRPAAAKSPLFRISKVRFFVTLSANA